MHGSGAPSCQQSHWLLCCSIFCLLQIVFVLNADDSGHIKTPVPGTPGGPDLQRSIDWVLVDGMTVRAPPAVDAI